MSRKRINDLNRKEPVRLRQDESRMVGTHSTSTLIGTANALTAS